MDLVRVLHCCPSEPTIPDETDRVLVQILNKLHDLRVSYELGDFTTDDVYDGLAGLRELLPRIDQPPARRDADVSFVKRAADFLMTVNTGGFMVDPTHPPRPGTGPLTPEEVDAIERSLERLKDLLKSASAEIRAILDPMVERVERLLVAQSPETRRAFLNLLAAFKIHLPIPYSILSDFVRQVFRGIGRWFGVIMWLLRAWEIGWLVGGEIAKVEINRKETIGTWWGNRFWDLVKGPCPDLLEALNQAINAWHAAEASHTADAVVAQALARVLVLESEYIRRCLAADSPEREREERYRETLKRQYRKLTDPKPAGSTPDTAGTCKVKITLTGVDYSGDDIGNDWKLTLAVDGHEIDVPVTDIANGTSRALTSPVMLYEGGFTPCSGVGLVTLRGAARQKHILGDSVGTNTKLLRPRCPTDANEKLAVWVLEESTFWGTHKGALITFTHHVQAACD